MIELYLLLTFVGNQPTVHAYASENDACQAMEAQTNASTLYKEIIDRHDNATFVEGTCKPLKQFVTVK